MQASEVAARLGELVRSGAALPILRLEYFPRIGSKVVEASYLDFDRMHHTMFRFSEGTSAKGDISRLPEALLINACVEAGVTAVLMDLSRVTFLNGVGLGILVFLYAKVERQGGKLALLNTQPRVLTALQCMNLDSVLEMFGSEGEALEFLGD